MPRDSLDDSSPFYTRADSYTQTIDGKPLPPNANYMILVQHEGRMHATPLSTFMLRKPDLSYVESQRASKEAAAQSEDQPVPPKRLLQQELDAEEDDGPQRINVTVNRRESEIARQKREASYSYMMEATEKEAWLKLEPHFVHGEHEGQRANPLIGVCLDDASAAFEVSPSQYISILTPQLLSKQEVVHDASLSLAALMQCPLGERMQMLLTRVHLSMHDMLVRYCLKEELAILPAVLARVAHLVRGIWIARSESVAPELAPLRDYVLLLLTRNRVIDVPALRQSTGHNLTTIKEILRPLTTKNNQGYYELRMLDGDTSAFREVAAKKAEEWLANAESIEAAATNPQARKRAAEHEAPRARARDE